MYHNPDYIPQIDINAVHNRYESNKLRWQLHLAKTYSKKAAKTIASTALNQLAANTAAPILGVPSVIKTKQHIKRLEQLRNQTPYPCMCHKIDSATGCDAIMEYVLAKKQGKIYHKSLASIPVAATLETFRGALKSAYKRYHGTKGSNREKFAKILFNKARNGSRDQNACLYCQAIIAELLGNFTKHESWEEMFAILDWDQGWKIVFEKLAST